MVGFPTPFDYDTSIAFTVLTPKVLLLSVWPLPLSLATTRGISFDFSSSGYLDVSVPRVPHVHLCVQCTLHDSSSCVFPHSDISGSMLICSSPKLFAACHVLHRLPMPRHSPYALLSLNYLPFRSYFYFLFGCSLLFLLELLCLSYIFTVTCAFYRFWQNLYYIYLLLSEKPDLFQIFLTLSLSCTLIRFSMSILLFSLTSH